ncbi:MAG: hypothetical protein ACETVU_00300 [Desulfatiglandales bacterium]
MNDRDFHGIPDFVNRIKELKFLVKTTINLFFSQRFTTVTLSMGRDRNALIDFSPVHKGLLWFLVIVIQLLI